MPVLIRRGKFDEAGRLGNEQRVLVNPEQVVFARREADGSITVKLTTGDVIKDFDGTLEELERAWGQGRWIS